MLIGKVRPYTRTAIADSQSRIEVLQEYTSWHRFSTKTKSELISNAIETSFSDRVPGAEDPKKDSDPDLFIDEIPLELKTSKTTHTWRGGEYSKRESDYLLIAWNEDENGELEWFVCHTYLKESDWKSSKSNNYYATTIDLSYVLGLESTEVLIGSVIKKKVKHHACFEKVK